MGGMTYKDAGVDIDKKMSTLKAIGPLVQSTFNSGVLHDIGAFGGMFRGSFPECDDPILVATNDGVGTKVRTGVRAGRVRGLGHDIVNHCVDDILVQGAEPLFFFDYFASSVLDPAVFGEVVEGLVEACKAAGCALLGGETAEMPGVYSENEFDIVGFVVGVVDRARVWPRDVRVGDAVLGLRSDGLHTNGFSLVNRLIERDAIDLEADPGGLGESLADALLRPHRCYLPVIRALRERVGIHALAHITGGGLQDNVPRVLPEGVGCEIDRSCFEPNPVFRWLRQTAELDAAGAYHAFNMGCGMTVMLDPAEVEPALAALAEVGQEAWRIGELVAHDAASEAPRVHFTDSLA